MCASLRIFFGKKNTGTHQKRSRGGFTFIEVVVALGIVAVAFSAIVALARGTLGAIGVARRELVAANLAQEGVEVVRNIRDANWLAGKRADGVGVGNDCLSASGTWRAGLCDSGATPYRISSSDTAIDTGSAAALLRLQSNGTYSYNPSGAVTPFRREVFLTTVSGDEMDVRVVVRWCGGPVGSCIGERTLTVEDRLWNWIP